MKLWKILTTNNEQDIIVEGEEEIPDKYINDE